MAAKILANCRKILFQINFLKKPQESKVCPKKVGLFQFKVGWFKIKARTNLGPQNYMYLSAPGRLRGGDHIQISIKFRVIDVKGRLNSLDL